MITVIIAGGSGTRLWPLSTSSYPKHLLALTGERTLVQTAYDRASRMSDTVYVVTEAGHAHHVKEQLPNLPEENVIIEPGRRGTAHCIVLALDVIARRHSHDEPIAFIHSDHHIRDIDGFARSFTVAANISSQLRQIALIGIEPTFPSTSFGYIERADTLDGHDGAYRVQSFKEKPHYETAQHYIHSGRYLWNGGYFVASVATFLREMTEHAPELKTDFDMLVAAGEVGSENHNQVYLNFNNIVIDTALIEKVTNLAVVAAQFDWMDVGSFKELHDVVDKDEQGNYVQGPNIHALDNSNVYIRNEEQKPVAVIGLNDVIVVNTPDGVLVARKGASQRAGEVAKKLQS